MLLNILCLLAIIWLTFSIVVSSISLWYTYTAVLPFLLDWDDDMDSLDDQSQLTNNDIPEWNIGDDDIPF